MITCIMPTTQTRTWCIPLAIRGFAAQIGTETRELVVVSEDPAVGEIPEVVTHARFVPCAPGTPLGKKHNLGVMAARGEWIAKWDDDDWHAPNQLATLLDAARHNGVAMIGTDSLLFHELLPTRRTFRYVPMAVTRAEWLAGNTLLVRRDVALRYPFPSDRNSGVDTLFARTAIHAGVSHVHLDCLEMVVVLVHGQTTGRKRWPPTAIEFVELDGLAPMLGSTEIDAIDEYAVARLLRD